MTKELETLNQRLSYIVGENMATQLKNDGLDLDTVALVLAVNDVMAGNASRLTEELKKSTVEEIQKLTQEQQSAEQAGKATKNQEEGVAYLAENSQKEGVKTTDSGLQYKSLVSGDGETPKASNSVTVHYKGTLTDGTVFDSSYERGEPATFPVGGVISGWTEVLQLMNVGDKFEVTIPSDLAYGPAGSGPVIGPDAVLVFEVELLAIA
ncbi:MAG: FKBP-type peptidyl-prolyl cis-trans isomerase FklB [Methylophilaceae bacterium]|mgnify:CR=1 FL=1|jgi:FKBP-type peptidyl-prolyl cis-trans isomerase FklB|tara:strand:+ start:110 stop:736 length:627 start_codon:yes stop_codon:yes gene_type:complete